MHLRLLKTCAIASVLALGYACGDDEETTTTGNGNNGGDTGDTGDTGGDTGDTGGDTGDTGGDTGDTGGDTGDTGGDTGDTGGDTGDTGGDTGDTGADPYSSDDDGTYFTMCADDFYCGRTPAVPANCGNGTLDDGEVCDDGNNAYNDSCWGDCAAGCFQEDGTTLDDTMVACRDARFVDSDGVQRDPSCNAAFSTDVTGNLVNFISGETISDPMGINLNLLDFWGYYYFNRRDTVNPSDSTYTFTGVNAACASWNTGVFSWGDNWARAVHGIGSKSWNDNAVDGVYTTDVYVVSAEDAMMLDAHFENTGTDEFQARGASLFRIVDTDGANVAGVEVGCDVGSAPTETVSCTVWHTALDAGDGTVTDTEGLALVTTENLHDWFGDADGAYNFTFPHATFPRTDALPANEVDGGGASVVEWGWSRTSNIQTPGYIIVGLKEPECTNVADADGYCCPGDADDGVAEGATDPTACTNLGG